MIQVEGDDVVGCPFFNSDACDKCDKFPCLHDIAKEDDESRHA